MDDWRRKLYEDLVPEAQRPGMTWARDTALDIAMGYARSELMYVLSVAGKTARGSVNGDDIWIELGSARLRFTLDRKNGVITAKIPGRDEVRVAWDPQASMLTCPSVSRFDARAFVREAIDATVAAWKGK